MFAFRMHEMAMMFRRKIEIFETPAVECVDLVQLGFENVSNSYLISDHH